VPDQSDVPFHTSLVGDPRAPHRVAFLHGLFGRGRNFSRIAAGLKPEAQSLLVDEPNHGQSGWTEHFDYLQMADLVAAELRRSFAVAGPVDIVGHSMGGKVAMVLALRHPDLVRRLCIVDISPMTSPSARGEFEHLLTALRGLPLTEITSRSDADERLRGSIPEDMVRGFLLQNLARQDGGFGWEPNLQLLHSELATVMGFPDMTGSRFEGRVLWVRGERSDYVRDSDAPEMRALFPRTTLMTIRGAGHWVHAERPAEMIAALRTFLLNDRAESVKRG